MTDDVDYDAMIKAALLQIHLECRKGTSVVGLAEWLLLLAKDRDKLRKRQVVVPLRR